MVPSPPQVPDVDWLIEKIQGFVDSGVLKGHYDRVWVNPGKAGCAQTKFLSFSPSASGARIL